MDAAYKKRWVAGSSTVHPAAFDELTPKTLATATVDQVDHFSVGSRLDNLPLLHEKLAATNDRCLEEQAELPTGR